MSKSWRIFALAQSLILLGIGGYGIKLFQDVQALQAQSPLIEPLATKVEDLEKTNQSQNRLIEALTPTEEEMEATANIFQDYENRINNLQNSLNQLREVLKNQGGNTESNAARLQKIEEQLNALEALRPKLTALEEQQNTLRSRLESSAYPP